MPGPDRFISYCFFNQNFKSEYLGFKKSKATIANWGIKGIDWIRKTANEALSQSRPLHSRSRYPRSGQDGGTHRISRQPDRGGMFLTGEMMELIHGGVPNIVCIQPFGCLPNHIVGKGRNQRDQKDAS